MARAVLILDIDGVLNTTASQVARGKTHFVPAAVHAMKRMLKAVAFDLIISSSWREDSLGLLMDCLDAHGLGQLRQRYAGHTPILDLSNQPTRADEIECWLHRSSYRGQLAILDDEDCPASCALRPWWVVVGGTIGLDRSSARLALQLLSQGQPWQGG